MNWPSAAMLGLLYGLSEAALGLLKRSKTKSQETDRSSLGLLWITILCSVAVAILSARLIPEAASGLLAALYVPGVPIFALGLLLRWYAIFYLGRFFTVDVAIAADHRVIDSGPYRWVRHPSYTGALLAFLGFGICLGNWISLLVLMVPITAAFLWRIVVEEAALTRALGARYREYMARTRRLVPFLL